MSKAGVEDLIKGILDIARPEGGPKFFILDSKGREMFSIGNGPENFNIQMINIDNSGKANPKLPEGWELILYPLEVYGSRTGFLGSVVPSNEAHSWRKLIKEIHKLEGDRRLKEYEVDDLTEAIVRHHEEINVLIDMPKVLHLGLEPGEFWPKALDKVAKAVRARKAMVVLKEQGKGTYRIVCIWESGKAYTEGSRPGTGDPWKWLGHEGEDGLTGLAIKQGKTVTRETLENEPNALAPFEKGASTLMAIPLIPKVSDPRGEKVLGAIVLIDRDSQGDSQQKPFRSEDRKIASLICSQIATLLGNQLLAEFRKEIQIAGNIQQSLLPSRAPRIKGYDVAGRCEPAHFVGGDYFDFLEIQVNTWGVVIADVSGHNLASALMMPMTRAALQWVGKREKEANRIVAGAANLLYGNLTAAELFLTLFLVVIKEGDSKVSTANAGHNPPLLFRADSGDVKWLDVDGPLIGLLPEPDHELRQVELSKGDILILYTDGVTEATNESGEMFGEQRLASTVNQLRNETAEEVCSGIFRAVRSFGDTGQDDVTVVVIKKE